jgi:hypothetical protein
MSKKVRKILFKAKRTDNEEWVKGVFIPDCLESVHNQECEWGWIKHYWLDESGYVKNETVEVDRKTVSQFVDICDINGQEVFENDIIKATHNYYHYKVYIFEGKVYVEDYWGNAIRPTTKSFERLECEVVGNRFDNPELLEVKQ